MTMRRYVMQKEGKRPFEVRLCTYFWQLDVNTCTDSGAKVCWTECQPAKTYRKQYRPNEKMYSHTHTCRYYNTYLSYFLSNTMMIINTSATTYINLFIGDII